LKRSSGQSELDSGLALEKARLQTERYLILVRNVFEFAHNAVRSVILANGAAATALLTYLPHNGTQTSTILLALSLISFALGVALGILASCVAYLSQYDAMKRAQANDFNVELVNHRKRSLAVWMLFFGVACFVLGIFLAAAAVAKWA
jgi:threonine/homoserine efflux transporter RhtA